MSRRTTTDSVRNAARGQASRRPRTKLALCALAAATLASPLVGDVAAGADSIASLKAQAARVASQIDRNYERMDILDEQILQSRLKIQKLDAEIRDATKNVAAAKARAGQLRDQLGRRAAELYKQAGNSSVGNVDLGSLRTQGARQMYAAATSSRDNQLLSQVRNARGSYTRHKHTIETARAQADKERKGLESHRKQIEAVNRSQKALLAKTKGKLAAAVAAEQARRAAAEKARAQRLAAEAAARAAAQQAAQHTATTSDGNVDDPSGDYTGGGGDTNLGSGVAQNPNVEQAVQTALAQIGDPYVFATAGPNTFDCSGLVTYSYGLAGIGLPHSSQGLYASLPHVSVANLQRGDLVFFGSPIHHVGIYIGGGMMVHVPHTGDHVRTATIYRGGLVGGARVT